MTAISKKRPEDTWRPARLIPTSGIKGVDEQEMRATSALLSVMQAVPEFARSLLKRAGAPSGNIRNFIEVTLKTDAGVVLRPDGIVTVARGSTTWTALVEVKTGVRDLDVGQIEGYLDIARERGFDAVISISNQMTTALAPYPVSVDKRKTRSVALHHWSWVEILTEAILQREVRKVSDEDQAWILGELIAYLEHPQSGALDFQDMGRDWAGVRDGARQGTLRQSEERVIDVVTRWDQFMRYLCLHLSRELKVLPPKHVLPRDQKPADRQQYLVKQLVETGRLDGTLRIERAVGDLSLVADLRGRMIMASVEVPAPSDRGSAARLSWLARQLKSAPPNTRIDLVFKGGKSQGDTLTSIQEDPKRVLSDNNRDVKGFAVSLAKEMGSKRGGVQGSFIGESTELLLRFYREIVQQIRPWAAAPAKLPAPRETTDIATQPDNIVERVAREQSDVAASAPVESTPLGSQFT